MKQYECSIIGEFHTNHNEDFLTVCELGDDKILIAVMDGCSAGTESYFAATLTGKILKKIAKELSFKAFIEQKDVDLEDELRQITKSLFDELQFIKNRLMLEREEILNTLILGVVHIEHKKAEILAIGDGLICCNGNYTEYEQENKPDYLGYHLSEDFEQWFGVQKQRLSIENLSDLAISTDGIFTFKKFDAQNYESIDAQNLVDFLLIDQEGKEQKAMLTKKVYQIEKRFGLKPSDDLSIIRLIFD